MNLARSATDYADTLAKLLDSIERRGLTVFAQIDHAAAAREVGLEMPDEAVVILGNPKAGTPLMQRDPRVGIELPLRILIWSGPDGVCLGYDDVRKLSAGYDLEPMQGTLMAMADLLETLVTEAAG